ncbi:MAG TPA: ATP-binding cassette domain-containing protein [Thermoanaerobaculia bacterium]|nr:ATP-binding cassette domain-containing protein [Thermoanaerobaculia bacterium]
MSPAAGSAPLLEAPLLEAEGLVKTYRPAGGLPRFGRSWGRGRAPVRAVDGVDLVVDRGECVALVGESGSGKTTLGRCLVRLLEPDEGSVRFRGEDLLALSRGELRRRRRAFQTVFQDPYDSLSPRLRVGELLAEPLAAHGVVPRRARPARVAELLERVGLPADAAQRYPHEFSGGQRQRIGIARALATEPELLVADEPVSALDLSVRAQVLALLARLREELGLAVLLIAHDLGVVERVADRVVVMRGGRVVEEAPTGDLFARPAHPYTRDLLAAVPRLPESAWRGAAGPAGSGHAPVRDRT